jgi:nucleoside-diphosphate-sugar epimerase
MRIAITGATGNVGSALTTALLADGHEVVGVVRRPPASSGDGVSWVSADLSRDCQDTLVGAFTGADAVVHLVWGFQPSHHMSYLQELGVGGTRRVLDAVAAAGVPHLVHQSSIGAYSPRRDLRPVTEDWPTDGIPGSPYSRHKVAAERLLDEFGHSHPGVVVTRTRPGIIGQRAAASSQLRYFVPTLVPAAALSWVPVLPLDAALALPVVHAKDVAEAIRLALVGRVGGAFNLASGAPLGPSDVAEVLGARYVRVPASVLRAAVSASWHLRLQQVDPGWVDLAFQAPVLDSVRARTELGWSPTTGPRETLQEVVTGMRERTYGDTPALRARSVRDGLARAFRNGTVDRRTRP